MITDISQLDLNKSYTYKDYLSWNFPERVELLMGKIFKMSPAPSVIHQRISTNMMYALIKFLEDRRCDLFTAPFDVVLQKGTKTTVVQPDICVVCDDSKLDKQGNIKYIGNSPYKRYNMFLRWMVRYDNLDMGLWEKVSKKDLILPLDTHTFKVGQKLGLLNRKTYDLQSAILITNKLKEFDCNDPMKYDFAIYRMGQEKIV